MLYRDLPVGTVRHVDLSLDGRAVEADVLLHGRYRETARTDSIFWIAAPNIEFGWPNFFNVRDMSKILTGTALSYATPTLSSGRSIKDNDVMDGSNTPPSDMELFEGPLVSIDPADGESWAQKHIHGLCLAGVSYAFIERDLLDDESEFYQGTALLFEDAQGRILALTARTLGDGAYSCSDFLSSPEIEGENLAVRLADESVHEARLLWCDPDDRDLAVLTFEGEAPRLKGKKPSFSDGKAAGEYLMLLAFREDLPGGIHTQPLPAHRLLDEGRPLRRFHPDLKLTIREWCGALLLDGNDRVLGIVGRAEALSEEAALVVLDALPAVAVDNSEGEEE